MINQKKILWAEGTLLGPQHFQQWDNYHTSSLNFILQVLSPWSVGIIKLEIDEDSLKSGQLIIKKFQAIFPKGIIINYDDRYDPPVTRSLKKSGDIYLGIPISTQASGISGYPENNLNPAWLSCYETITDEYDSNREREVGFLKPNLQLLEENDDRSGFYSLKILDLNQDYIPCILQLEASSQLMDMVRSQRELLSAKIRLLRSRREATSFNQNDLTDFFLLQLFNQALPGLDFYFKHKKIHPSEYYVHLCGFLGAVSSFTDAIVLPDYSHNDLYKTFSELNKLYKNLLEAVIPSRMSALKLKRENDVLYSVDNIDSQVFEKNSFYLAVFFESENTEWLSKFTRQVKISARSVIESIVASALPGVRLVHTQRPPNKLPVKAGYEYFYIEPLGHFWDQLKSEKTLALFTSYDFLKAQIELVTVEE